MVYTAPTPETRDDPPPNPTSCLLRTGRWERNWVINQFSIEIFVCKCYSFLKNLNWFFAQTRKNLQLGFLISLKIRKNFQNPTKLNLTIIIKISLLTKKLSHNSWKLSKNCMFPLIFRLIFNNFVSVRGSAPPRTL